MKKGGKILSLLIAQFIFSANGAHAQRSLNDSVFDEANYVFNHAAAVRYSHHHAPAGKQVRFNGDSCTASTDCSGFVSYVLHKVAPKHYSAVHDWERKTPYPQAKAYETFFAQLDTSSPQEGWIKIRNFRELKRGDIIAWRIPKKPEHKGGNTGHVMIVAEKPLEVKEVSLDGQQVRCVDVPVIDSSSVDHFAPEELPPHAHQEHRDGLGKGTIRLIIDSDDRAIGYWEGTYWGEGHRTIHKPTFTRLIEFARLLPNT